MRAPTWIMILLSVSLLVSACSAKPLPCETFIGPFGDTFPTTAKADMPPNEYVWILAACQPDTKDVHWRVSVQESKWKKAEVLGDAPAQPIIYPGEDSLEPTVYALMSGGNLPTVPEAPSGIMFTFTPMSGKRKVGKTLTLVVAKK